jgi:hypothetical protein
MQIGLTITHLLLCSLPRSEVTSPVILWVVRVWEHVVVLNWPSQVLHMQSVQILSRSGVEQSDVCGIMLIEILNQFVRVLEVEAGVGKREVAAHWDKHVVSEVVVGHFVEVFLEIFCFLVGVEVVKLFVRYERIIVPEALIVPEAGGPAIVVPHSTSEDLLLVSKVLGKWSPQVVHRPIFQSLVTVCVVKSCEEPSFKAHIGEQSRVGVGVAKWINMPSNSWFDTEFLQQKLMAMHHVVDHVLKVRACLVMHTPASVNKLKATFLNQHLHVSLYLVSLSLVPHRKEFHLNVRESTFWIIH